MTKRLLLLFLYSFFFVFGCTREISVQLPGPVVEEGQISGRVILPANTKTDTTGLIILSAVGSSTPIAQKFAMCMENREQRSCFNESLSGLV